MTSYTKTQAQQKIASTLADLAGQKVLLLLSGGSSAQIGAQALAELDANLKQNITVALADERFVAYESEDSNAKLLRQLGIIDNCNQFIEVLSVDETTREQAAQQYRQKLSEAQQNADFVVAVLGIGVDNHTAGILPRSEAVESDQDVVVDYASEQFERITIAPKFFPAIDYIFVYAEGDQKEAAAIAIGEEHPVVDYPSQLVKQASSYELLFNKESL